MIEKIELKNFESHEHTIVSGLSSGLNLICGLSNSGKTSIIRALKLVAYNEFDPRAVRAGEKNCEVTVTTHRGTVKVIKGKDNVWEITPKGGKTEQFTKIGKNILQDAVDIVGFGMVKLGDVEMPVNIMNQLEGHFMLSELNGKNASGSVRAQVIDEISGLSGIEGLIKAVSLDNHRWGREVKVLEDRMEEVRGDMHDLSELDAESRVLALVGACLKDRDECKDKWRKLSWFRDSAGDEAKAIGEIDSRLSEIPDIDAVSVWLSEATIKIRDGIEKKKVSDEWENESELKGKIESQLLDIPNLKIAGMALASGETKIREIAGKRKLSEEWKEESVSIDKIEKQLSAIGDATGARKVLTNVGEKVAKAKEAKILFSEWDEAKRITKRAMAELALLGGIDEALILSDKVVSMYDGSWKMSKLKERIDQSVVIVNSVEKEIIELDKVLTEARGEHDEMLKSFKVCPLSLMPISGKCLEGMEMRKGGSK